jgi:hypothetical protein
MRTRGVRSAAFLSILIFCGCHSPTETGGGNSSTVTAARGGTVESSGVRLVQHGFGTWTFYANADDGHHDLATTQSRTITIDQEIR